MNFEKNGVKTDVHKSDMQEMAEMFDTMVDKIPALIKSLIGTLYSAEAAKSMGQAIGGLYKELLASGIPENVAIDMAKNYMFSFKDISNMTNNKA